MPNNIINIRLHNSGNLDNNIINVLKQRIDIIQQIFDKLINSICDNQHQKQIIDDFLIKMGPDYTNHICNNSIDNISIEDFKQLTICIDRFKKDLISYPKLLNNNVFNLYLTYDLIMIVKKISNLSNTRSFQDINQLFNQLIESIDQLNKIFTYRIPIPDKNTYLILDILDGKLNIDSSINQLKIIEDSKDKIQGINYVYRLGLDINRQRRHIVERYSIDDRLIKQLIDATINPNIEYDYTDNSRSIGLDKITDNKNISRVINHIMDVYAKGDSIKYDFEYKQLIKKRDDKRSKIRKEIEYLEKQLLILTSHNNRLIIQKHKIQSRIKTNQQHIEKCLKIISRLSIEKEKLLSNNDEIIIEELDKELEEQKDEFDKNLLIIHTSIERHEQIKQLNILIHKKEDEILSMKSEIHSIEKVLKTNTEKYTQMLSTFRYFYECLNVSIIRMYIFNMYDRYVLLNQIIRDSKYQLLFDQLCILSKHYVKTIDMLKKVILLEKHSTTLDLHEQTYIDNHIIPFYNIQIHLYNLSATKYNQFIIIENQHKKKIMHLELLKKLETIDGIKLLEKDLGELTDKSSIHIVLESILNMQYQINTNLKSITAYVETAFNDINLEISEINREELMNMFSNLSMQYNIRQELVSLIEKQAEFCYEYIDLIFEPEPPLPIYESTTNNQIDYEQLEILFTRHKIDINMTIYEHIYDSNIYYQRMIQIKEFVHNLIYYNPPYEYTISFDSILSLSKNFPKIRQQIEQIIAQNKDTSHTIIFDIHKLFQIYLYNLDTPRIDIGTGLIQQYDHIERINRNIDSISDSIDIANYQLEEENLKVDEITRKLEQDSSIVDNPHQIVMDYIQLLQDLEDLKSINQDNKLLVVRLDNDIDKFTADKETIKRESETYTEISKGLNDELVEISSHLDNKQLDKDNLLLKLENLSITNLPIHTTNSYKELVIKLIEIYTSCKSIDPGLRNFFEHEPILLTTATKTINLIGINNNMLLIIKELIHQNLLSDINQIFTIIRDGLRYLSYNHIHCRSMPVEFDALIKQTNGIKFGKFLYENKTNKQLQLINLSVYQSSNNLYDTKLDKIIRNAMLFTLCPSNKLIRPLIDSIIKIIDKISDKLQIYTTDNCIIYQIFNIEKMRSFLHTILQSNNQRIIRRACAYRRINTQILSGGGLSGIDSYFNLINILKENPQEINRRCSITSDNKCALCNKFITDKTNFKKLVGKMVKKDDMMEVLDLMNYSVDLLPIVILGKDDFHKFHIRMQEYKQSIKY